MFRELHALLAKPTGVFHLIREALVPLADSIAFAIVYGSFSKGERGAESDIDFMLAEETSRDELLEQVSPVERALNRPINPTIDSRDELPTKIQSGIHLLRAVRSRPLRFLVGSEYEFKAIR